jgi:hypothetical protein
MSFSRTNLNDVDPNFTTVNEGTYSLRVVKADLTAFVNSKTGEDSERVNLGLTIFNHPEYSGRRIWETLWEGAFGLRAMRKIMDASGVAQSSDEELASWLERTIVEKAEFKAFVSNEEDLIKGTPNPRTVKPDGSASLINRVDWKTIAPVS